MMLPLKLICSTVVVIFSGIHFHTARGTIFSLLYLFYKKDLFIILLCALVCTRERAHVINAKGVRSCLRQLAGGVIQQLGHWW
jgi:hypothetical protein